jgi:hypothetical protein
MLDAILDMKAIMEEESPLECGVVTQVVPIRNYWFIPHHLVLFCL